MRKRVINKKYCVNSKRKNAKDRVEEDSNEGDVLVLMCEKMTQTNPSIPKLKSYMATCRNVRLLHIKTCKSATDHINCYPALGIPEMVSIKNL